MLVCRWSYSEVKSAKTSAGSAVFIEGKNSGESIALSLVNPQIYQGPTTSKRFGPDFIEKVIKTPIAGLYQRLVRCQ
jgi:hypothetical protein